MAGLDEILPAVTRAIARHGADRVAMIVGTTTAGLGRTEDAYHQLRHTGALPPDYDLHRQHSFGALMEALRRVTGIGGPCFAVSTACSASAKAVGCAQRLLATTPSTPSWWAASTRCRRPRCAASTASKS